MSDYDPSRNVGWGMSKENAPVADKSLVKRALSVVEEGQGLEALFVPKPTDKVKEFMGSLSSRARAALENYARGNK